MVFESFRSAAITFTNPVTPTATNPGTMTSYNQGVSTGDSWRAFGVVRLAGNSYSGGSCLQYTSTTGYIITPAIYSSGNVTLSFRYRNTAAGNSSFAVDYCPVGAQPAGLPSDATDNAANPASTTSWVSLGTVTMTAANGTAYSQFTSPTFAPGAGGYYVRIRRTNAVGSVPIIDDLAWSSNVDAENTQVVLPTQTSAGATSCSTIAMPQNGVITFSDNGGLSDTYNNAIVQDHTVTFTPFPGQRIQMRFASPVPINIVSGKSYDVGATPTGSITISNSDNNITNYTTNSAPATVYTSTAPGCAGTITVRYVTNSGTVGTGFALTVSSIDPASCTEITGYGVNSSNIKYNEIPLTWTGLTGCTAPSNGYDYYVSDTNIPPSNGALTPSSTTSLQAGNVPSGTSTGVTVTGLAGNTQYFIWVRSDCGSTYGTWFQIPGTFRTLCTPIPVPPTYTVDFNGGVLPTCTSTNSGSSGVTTFFFNSAAGTWFFSNPLSLDPTKIYRLSFDYSNSAGSATSVSAYYGKTDFAVTPGALTNLLTTVSTSSTTYTTSRSYFQPTLAGTYYIGIRLNSLSGGAFKLDNLELREVPCFPAATPVITGPPTSPCPSTTATYSCTATPTAVSSTPDSYTWTVPSGWVITSGQGTSTINVTTSVLTGNISVVANLSGCDSSPAANYGVTVSPIPAQPSTISGSASVCTALPATGLVYSVTNVSGVTYNWTFPTGWTITSGAGTSSVTVTATASAVSGTITVTPNISGGCAGTPRTRSVIIGSVNNNACTTAATITSTATDTFRCSERNFWYAFTAACSGSYKFNLSGNGGDIDLYVYGTCPVGTALGSGTTGSASESVTVTLVAGTTYYVRVFEYVTPAGNGGTFNLNVASTSIGTLGAITGTSSISCSSTTITNYSVVPIAGVTTYNWTLPAGWVLLSGAGTDTITIRSNGSTAGTLSVYGSGPCGDSTTSTKLVTVGQIPPGAVTGPADLCGSTSSVTYTASTATGATSYTWTVPAGWSITSGATTNTITVIPTTTAGTVSVVANGPCGVSPVSSLAVSTSTPVVTTGAATCQGSASTNLTASLATLSTFPMPDISGGTPTFIRPFAGTTFSSSGVNAIYSTQVFVPTVTGDYTFDGCEPGSIDTFMVIYTGTFNPLSPGTGFLAANDDSNPSLLCNLDPRLTVTLTAGQTYTMVYTTYSSVSTVTSLSGVTVTVTPPVGGGVQLGVVEWYTAPTGGSAIGTGTSFNPVGVAGSGLPDTNTPGTYVFYASNTLAPACRTLTNYVINPSPTINFSIPSSTVCSVAVTPVSVTGTANTYTWTSTVANTLFSDSSGTTAYVAGTNASTVYVKTNATATIAVAATITATGCTATSSIVLTVSGAGKIWNGANWGGPAPTLSDNVVFNGNYSGGSVQSCTCSVNGSSVVTFASGETLTVVGNLTVAPTASLSFDNGASLVQLNTPPVSTNPNSGVINYKRDTWIRRFDYTYWSAPVENQILANFSPLTQPDKYYWFDSSALVYNWVNVAAPGLTTMDIARGYIIRAPQTFSTTTLTFWSGTFSGKPNNGDYSVTINKNGANDLNLIGNPYPSAISADLFIAQNPTAFSLTGTTGGTTLYFWTHKTNYTGGSYVFSDYATYNFTGGTSGSGSPGASQPDALQVPDGNIAAGQSFMTKGVVTGSRTATFRNSMRIAGNNLNFFSNHNRMLSNEFAQAKSELMRIQSLERNRFWLQLSSSDGGFKEALIGYVQGATNSYDNGFDGDLLDFGNSLNFYSLLDNTMLTIQGRSLPFDESDVVSLGYSTTVANTYNISIARFDGLFENQNVYLVDNLMNVEHNLKQGPYTFATETGTFNNRFQIKFTSNLSVANPQFNQNSVVVTNDSDNIHIKSSSKSLKSVEIFDVRGRLVLSRDYINKTTTSFTNVGLAHQVLIVNVISEDGKKVTKKIIM